MGTSGRSAKQPVFSAYNKGPDGILGEVIVDIHVAVLGVANELFPNFVEITQRVTEQAFGQGAVQGFVQPIPQDIKDRNAFFLSQLATSFAVRVFRLLFDSVQFSNIIDGHIGFAGAGGLFVFRDRRLSGIDEFTACVRPAPNMANVVA